MTATQLFEAIAGLPTEATCGTIRYDEPQAAWFDHGYPGKAAMIFDDHAEALQRDAMIGYLSKQGWVHIKRDDEACTVRCDKLDESFSEVRYPHALLALIAAVRHVAGEGK